MNINKEFEIRLITRTGICRGCDRKLIKNEDYVFHTYSMANRGQHIFFCMDCLHIISGAFDEWLMNAEKGDMKEITGRFE